MKSVVAMIEGVRPYASSKKVEQEIEEKASWSWEQAYWKEKLHYDEETDEVFIPGVSFKLALESTASYLSMKKKGNSTWTKHFRAGIIMEDDVWLGQGRDQAKPVKLFLDSNGKRDSGSRVFKIIPHMTKWSGEVKLSIVDDELPPDIFAIHLIKAGHFNGVGQWRPQKGGMNGRWKVKSFDWEGLTQTEKATWNRFAEEHGF